MEGFSEEENLKWGLEGSVAFGWAHVQEGTGHRPDGSTGAQRARSESVQAAARNVMSSCKELAAIRQSTE